ncbi:MAG: cytochrome b [Hoeflea sp.]|uniref:cytochrome b n=1 Tax=Hoeflea sp. TaxID=1940281 RepID=UPI001DB35A8D|nr:cytochrome b [Hoeflea sp.]MBU4530146.1 cytochrome b [Alphaproteobacteria bacterium]MBU4542569.1 cytochrome b [Alphaproteobacteria bacterium]MBU4551250.1 cytochrome b [Alphaproteobacteria bacterium]MBV1723073.1 cytochrome b [Hoeflea sp.]MBV1760084.1 cytochrome b [Hoeflea sp.]
MTLKSTPTAYGAVAAGLHWLSVLLIVALLASGMLADQASDPAAKTSILAAHAPMGIAILILTLARIVWWWRFDTHPQPLPDPAWQVMTAKALHGLLYVVVLGMAASGIGMFVLSGAGEIVFGGAALPLPDFADFTPRIPHGIGAKLLLALFIGHAGAALYHHFVKRDATLKRMWFSR